MTEPIGQVFHQRYRVRSKLGQGGMGAVYLADDLRLPGRQVAVKENLAPTGESQQQFKREAVALARLRHPNLPQVTDYFTEAGGRQYLVMDYVPGENLQQILTRLKGPLPVDEALSAVEQVMQALHFMHHWRDPETNRSSPIVHRDIKPANIKRTPEGRIVLVDFGIAKLDSRGATALSARALTPGYAPLEQYNGGTDERSDLYSLGATLYVLLTGVVPPSATNMAAGAQMPGVKRLNAGVPERYAKVIERALRLQAKDRYQSVDEMYLALFGRPLTTAPVSRRTTGAPAAAPATGRRPGWMPLLIGIGLLIAGSGLWYAFAANQTREEGANGQGAPSTGTVTPAQEEAVAPVDATPSPDGAGPAALADTCAGSSHTDAPHVDTLAAGANGDIPATDGHRHAVAPHTNACPAHADTDPTHSDHAAAHTAADFDESSGRRRTATDIGANRHAPARARFAANHYTDPNRDPGGAYPLPACSHAGSSDSDADAARHHRRANVSGAPVATCQPSCHRRPGLHLAAQYAAGAGPGVRSGLLAFQ
jgi:serine/threonine-protein kinase